LVTEGEVVQTAGPSERGSLAAEQEAKPQVAIAWSERNRDNPEFTAPNYWPLQLEEVRGMLPVARKVNTEIPVITEAVS
jgi:hypothetical protein